MSDTIVLEGLDRSTVKCLVTWIENGTFELPMYTPGICPLDNPSAHVQRVLEKHRTNVLGYPGTYVIPASLFLALSGLQSMSLIRSAQ